VSSERHENPEVERVFWFRVLRGYLEIPSWMTQSKTGRASKPVIPAEAGRDLMSGRKQTGFPPARD
jgi:hypothetical protein